MNITIRDGKKEDLPFVYASWLNSYKNDSEFARRIRNSIFFDWHHRIIEGILAKSDCELKVACLPDDEDVILGYLVHDSKALHYMFIKSPWRKLGIASKLFKSLGTGLPIYFTHWTEPLDKITVTHENLIYNPYLI